MLNTFNKFISSPIKGLIMTGFCRFKQVFPCFLFFFRVKETQIFVKGGL